ncbi:hypothetical protein FQN54_004784 [Arachnomyces sp. PD_36]|nr:hypothetical protein FQN54_004784 [Arachnomyces sp. PD_36]
MIFFIATPPFPALRAAFVAKAVRLMGPSIAAKASSSSFLLRSSATESPYLRNGDTPTLPWEGFRSEGQSMLNTEGAGAGHRGVDEVNSHSLGNELQGRRAHLDTREGSEPILEPPLEGKLPILPSASRDRNATVDDAMAGLVDNVVQPTELFCGKTSSHCLYGCQEGKCSNKTALEPVTGVDADMHPRPGRFQIVGQSGVPAMAAGLMPNGRVFFLDKVENYTQLKLDNDQYAYSAEYDPITNEPVALPYKTNAFCSGGVFLADGSVIAVGGNGPLEHIDSTIGDGFTAIRYLKRSQQSNGWDGQPWSEPGNKLSSPRWYGSAQLLADGRVFVASGSANGLDPTKPQNNNPTYEILDRSGYSTGLSVTLSILEGNQPYYMYPFLHLLKDGNLFIFVARSAEIFDPHADETVRTLPDLRGDYRTYPNTGGSVLLPLSSENQWEPDILVCGGGSYQGLDSPTDASCGRIQPLSEYPRWEMDAMPSGRGMVEGTLLPDGTTLWLNGCNKGAQGFGIAKDPVYEAWIYDPKKPLGFRWSIGASSKVARLYHSVALLLLDGTVMITGSNPAEQPILKTDPKDPIRAFPTEFRVEIYTPPYLDGLNALKRPTDVVIPTKYLPANGHVFSIRFKTHEGAWELKIVLYHGGFVTHSVHMGHRMIYLDSTGFIKGRTQQEVKVEMPPHSSISPPGPYVIYVVVDGIPSVGQFVTVE